MTRGDDVTFNEQPDPDRLYYEIQEVARILCNEEHEAARERLLVTLAVTETIERARRAAGIVFPGEETGVCDG